MGVGDALGVALRVAREVGVGGREKDRELTGLLLVEGELVSDCVEDSEEVTQEDGEVEVDGNRVMDTVEERER